MTKQSTVDKLIEMRLTAMADAFRNQCNDPKYKEIPFEDRFGMLVDIEFTSRKKQSPQATDSQRWIRSTRSKYYGHKLYFWAQVEQKSD